MLCMYTVACGDRVMSGVLWWDRYMCTLFHVRGVVVGLLRVYTVGVMSRTVTCVLWWDYYVCLLLHVKGVVA